MCFYVFTIRVYNEMRVSMKMKSDSIKDCMFILYRNIQLGKHIE